MPSIKECYACSDVRSKALWPLRRLGGDSLWKRGSLVRQNGKTNGANCMSGPSSTWILATGSCWSRNSFVRKGSRHLDKLLPIRSTTVTGIGHA